MKTLNELHAVKVVRTNEQGESFTSYLTYRRWVKSFVEERWNNERRYQKDINPLFGNVYHKNVVTDGFGSKSVREFTFAQNEDEARAMEAEYQNSLR